MKIGVIDHGAGNPFSVGSALRRIGADAIFSSDPKTLGKCDKLVLPGVGAFAAAMDRLRELKLVGFIRDAAKDGVPLLGICLGMQLLFSRSFEFGEHEGLGLIEGDVLPLADALSSLGSDAKVPAICWNALEIVRPSVPAAALSGGEYAYYVHSYYAPVGKYTSVCSDYYGVKVTGIAEKGNVSGCQFHPEKSGSVGLGILAAFVNGAGGGEA